MTAGGFALDEYLPLRRVAPRRARASFPDPDAVARGWKGLGYAAPPDPARAAEPTAG